jgi:hypothetical protein
MAQQCDQDPCPGAKENHTHHNPRQRRGPEGLVQETASTLRWHWIRLDRGDARHRGPHRRRYRGLETVAALVGSQPGEGQNRHNE